MYKIEFSYTLDKSRMQQDVLNKKESKITAQEKHGLQCYRRLSSYNKRE